MTDPVYDFDKKWKDLQTSWDDLHISESERPSHAPNIWGQSQAGYDSPYAAHYYTGPNELKIGNITGLGQELQKIITSSQQQGQALFQRIEDGGVSKFDDWREGFESDLEDRLSGGIGQGDLDSLRDDLQKQLDDLTDRGVGVGEVEGLSEQLAALKDEAATGDENIQNLLDKYKASTDQELGYYMKTSDYEQSMSDNLQSLKDTLKGEWGEDIQQLDIESIRQAVGKSQGDLTSLTSDFAGLGADLRLEAQHSEGQRDLLRQQLESNKDLSAAQRDAIKQQIGDLEGDVQQQYTDLSDKLSSGLTNLEGTFEGRIGDVKSALGADLAALTGQQADLSTDLSGVKTALGDYQASTRDDLLDLKDQLTSQADITDQALQDVYKTREQRFDDLSSEWGQNLRDQESQMSAKIDKGQQAINDRLSNLVSSMNYRTLGNTALGIKSRRSEAYTSGASSRGTTQLGRGTRLKTLNIA